mmetsp:Transcript_4415/g.7661  ORF Transcript_4415/g.7661 Transcript_4415/m.7661 type:complete len:208 (+) Transcript_4415:740-1363(+)
MGPGHSIHTSWNHGCGKKARARISEILSREPPGGESSRNTRESGRGEQDASSRGKARTHEERRKQQRQQQQQHAWEDISAVQGGYASSHDTEVVAALVPDPVFLGWNGVCSAQDIRRDLPSVEEENCAGLTLGCVRVDPWTGHRLLCGGKVEKVFSCRVLPSFRGFGLHADADDDGLLVERSGGNLHEHSSEGSHGRLLCDIEYNIR